MERTSNFRAIVVSAALITISANAGHCQRSHTTALAPKLSKIVASSCTDLGTLGGRFSAGEAINSYGDVVGFSATDTGREEGFLYTAGHISVINAATTSPADNAESINDHRTVVGEVQLSLKAVPKAYIATQKSVRYMEGQALEYMPSSLNNAGDVVGSALIKNGSCRAFLFQNGNAQILNPTGQEATWINDKGVIVGDFTSKDGATHACEWIADKRLELGLLKGTRMSWAMSINHNGVVVGNCFTTDGTSIAFLYRDGRMQKIGVPAEYHNAYAYGINDFGDIVGRVSKSHKSVAFIDRGGVFSLILGPGNHEFQAAKAINNSGDILCWGRYRGAQHTFLIRF